MSNFTLINGANFNRILSARQARTVQFGARVECEVGAGCRLLEDGC